MNCRECPYIKEEFGIKSQSINNEYELMEIEQNCWCEKVGAKIYWYGECSDKFDDIPTTINSSKQKKKNKRERDQRYNQRLKFLAKNFQSYFLPPAIYTTVIWTKECGLVDNLKPYYKRLYRNKHRTGRNKYYKKLSNRIVRQYNGELHNGCNYKKVFNLRWNV